MSLPFCPAHAWEPAGARPQTRSVCYSTSKRGPMLACAMRGCWGLSSAGRRGRVCKVLPTPTQQHLELVKDRKQEAD